MIRKIVKIDEEKCTGCGLCASACHENAIVMENGKIVGNGTHKELLETCKTYREIAESQMTAEELYGKGGA